MPWKMTTAPDGKRWVRNAVTGRKTSKHPMTVANAKAQLARLQSIVKGEK